MRRRRGEPVSDLRSIQPAGRWPCPHQRCGSGGRPLRRQDSAGQASAIRRAAAPSSCASSTLPCCTTRRRSCQGELATPAFAPSSSSGIALERRRASSLFDSGAGKYSGPLSSGQRGRPAVIRAAGPQTWHATPNRRVARQPHASTDEMYVRARIDPAEVNTNNRALRMDQRSRQRARTSGKPIPGGSASANAPARAPGNEPTRSAVRSGRALILGDKCMTTPRTAGR